MQTHPPASIPVDLMLAWATSSLSGVSLSVLYILAIDCWCLGPRREVSRLRVPDIVRLTGKSRSQVNTAIRSLCEQGFVERLHGRRLRLVPDVPQRLQGAVNARLAEISAKPHRSAGKPFNLVRETGQTEFGGAAASPASSPEASSETGRAAAELLSDQRPPEQRLEVLKSKLVELAVQLSKRTRGNREVILEQLLTVRAPLDTYERAIVTTLHAARDPHVPVASDPAAMLQAAVDKVAAFTTKPR